MYSIVLGMYLPPVGEAHAVNNRWVAHFTSAENRHALPLFTSLLNLVCSYDPAGILPYNHLIFQVRTTNLFVTSKNKTTNSLTLSAGKCLLKAFKSKKQFLKCFLK
jgi:hypothetical protein